MMHCLFSGECLTVTGAADFHAIFSLRVICSRLVSCSSSFFEQSPWHVLLYSSMALLKPHSNRTAKQPGYKKTIASFGPCTQSASLPVAKMFRRTTKGKEETKEKMTHSWVSLRAQEAPVQGILHMSPHRKRSPQPSYRWVAFPPMLPRTSWFILSSPPTQLSPHFILQST